MNSDQEKLNSLLRRLAEPGAVPLSAEETQWLEDFKSRYPFFTLPTTPDGEIPPLHDVVTAPSPESLARMQGNADASRFDNFYPVDKGPATPSTTAAIDNFLNTYGHQSEEEDQLLERLIFNPVPDYAQQLAREEEESLPPDPDSQPTMTSPSGRPIHPDSPEARLNRFILSHRAGIRPRQEEATPAPTQPQPARNQPVIPAESKPAPRRTETPKATPPDGLLSESLAKIYIKTRRYERAYEILNGLSLRFPEKSRYFADQLRFLQKLILNEQRHQIENKSEINPNS